MKQQQTAINIKNKFEKITSHFSPKNIARMNDYHFKLCKFKGDFVWHKHDETDEVFIVIKGKMTLEMRDGNVRIAEGEMFVVPKGVEHKPVAAEECHLMLVEPAGTVNTGDAGGDMTAPHDQWI